MAKSLSEKLNKTWYDLKVKYLKKYKTTSYSQGGVDLVLNQLLDYRKEGFFVDVGAHHPKKYSNTYLFYKRGWRGINIDVLPGTAQRFQRVRPRDINLELGISKTPGELIYHMFNEPALNGFNAEVAASRTGNTRGFELIKKVPVQTVPLADVLVEHLPPGQDIDFFSVDTEGLDLEVLQSNNWDKFRPKFIAVEALKAKRLDDLLNDPVYLFLEQQGYEIRAKLFVTLIFERKP